LARALLLFISVKAVTLPLLFAALFAVGSAHADEARDDVTDEKPAAKPRPEAAGFHGDLTFGSSARQGHSGPSGGTRFGYGFASGAVVIGPQVSIDLAVSGDLGAVALVPGVRVELPIEHFGPYLEGGIGLGYASGARGTNGDGLQPIFELGGGALYHFGSHFAVGVEALFIVSYDSHANSDPFGGGWRYGPLFVGLF
jgi:Lipid A 3-O-deacylase (PagL)